MLAIVEREEDSIDEQGENLAAWFAWDSLCIIILVRTRIPSTDMAPSAGELTNSTRLSFAAVDFALRRTNRT